MKDKYDIKLVAMVTTTVYTKNMVKGVTDISLRDAAHMAIQIVKASEVAILEEEAAQIKGLHPGS